MPKFRVYLERLYRLREQADISVTAESPEEAKALAIEFAKADYDDGDDDLEWAEVDGGVDPDSFDVRAVTTDPES